MNICWSEVPSSAAITILFPLSASLLTSTKSVKNCPSSMRITSTTSGNTLISSLIEETVVQPSITSPA
ncbi:ORF911 [White spot syndrome virus]|uniref:ORF911 n=1 Tax=White spot syndrome virus TaxID=342409 RepID=A0A2D3I6P5_9VIRU|nr:ORF911 [White spot syndrome virus]